MSIYNILSEENILMHKEYVNACKAKYSFLLKSNPRFCNLSLLELSRFKKYKTEANSIVRLKSEILCHDLYFSSFGNKNQPITDNKNSGGISDLLYSIYNTALNTLYGFLILYKDNDEIMIYSGNDYQDIFVRYSPLISIDLFEHSYFMDYGFDKERYIKNALSYLNLSVID